MSGKVQPGTFERFHTVRVYHEAGYDMPDIALSLGLTYSQVQNVWLRYRHRPPPIPPGWSPPIVPDRAGTTPDALVAERTRLDRRREMREDRELLSAVAGEQSLRAFLEKLARDTCTVLPAPPTYVSPKPSKQRTTETMLMQWSDWHAYELVSAERTRGFGEYNARIFGQRVKRVVESHLSIKERMERGGGWRFPELVIGANGDFVSGTIHEVERHSDAPNIVLAVYGCARVMAEGLRDLAGQYERIRVYCTSGNHGRLPDAKRMQQKDPLRSWDAMIYLLAKEMVKDCKNVELHIPDSYSVAFEVEGWRVLQTHGHDVKSWNSIPHYGINRLVGNLNALEASRNQAIAYFLFGHFHNKTSLEHAAGEWFINGSLIGGTEFGIQTLGKSDKPCQWMLAFHPEHGVTHRWPLSGLTEKEAEGYQVKPWLGAA